MQAHISVFLVLVLCASQEMPMFFTINLSCALFANMKYTEFKIFAFHHHRAFHLEVETCYNLC